jgi:hypothetical protein
LIELDAIAPTPSPETSLTAIAMGEILQDLGCSCQIRQLSELNKKAEK